MDGDLQLLCVFPFFPSFLVLVSDHVLTNNRARGSLLPATLL